MKGDRMIEKRFINANEISLRLPFEYASGEIYVDIADVKKAIAQTPTADVEDVRHGEWIPDYETFVDEYERESAPVQTGWYCSMCGRQVIGREPYCHCGAKMDGQRRDQEYEM